MAKFFIIYGLEFLIGLILITQIIIPMFTNKPFFWFFRSEEKPTVSTFEEFKQKAQDNKDQRDELKDQVSTVKKAVDDVENLIK